MHFFETLNWGNIPTLGLVAWGLVLLALVFDFLNGFHDAANSVATVVSTRVLSPQAAVIWAAVFNFVAFAVFPLKVADTIRGTINADVLRSDANTVMAAILIAACAWNILTWYLALPTSSSHALIGAMVGVALAKTWSLGALNMSKLMLTVVAIVLSPTVGLLCGLIFAVAVAWTFRRATPRGVDKIFRQGQLFSAAWFSLNHGGNDAQKTMGIIALLITLHHPDINYAKQPLPTEIVLACHFAIGVGTLFGGWRIVKTMGQKIIALRPVDGFCAENGAGVALALATSMGGIPVSTTHTITGSIIGVGGALKRFSAVRWGVAGRVIWAWVLTIPGAALMAALSWYLLKPLAILD